MCTPCSINHQNTSDDTTEEKVVEYIKGVDGLYSALGVLYANGTIICYSVKFDEESEKYNAEIEFASHRKVVITIGRDKSKK